MNRVLFLVILFSLSSFNSFSQTEKFRYGARFALGESNISGPDLGEEHGKLALSVGLASVYQFTTFFGMEADVFFVSKGTRITYEQVIVQNDTSGTFQYEETYNLHSVQVPIMPKLSFGFENFFVKFFGGPGLNFNVLGTISREYEDNGIAEENNFDAKKIYKIIFLNFSAIAGAGFDVETPEGIFSIDFRQNVPLGPFGKINGKEAENIYFTIGLGYLFN